MLRTELTLPELALLAGTRGMLGAGIGLLAADRLGREARKGVGFALLAVGVLTTIPLLVIVRNARVRYPPGSSLPAEPSETSASPERIISQKSSTPGSATTVVSR